MAKTISQWLAEYGESHQNATNKRVHWVCVPAIMFSIIAMVRSIPFPVETTWYANWTAVLLVPALLFYLRLSFSLFVGFVFIAIGMLLLTELVVSLQISLLYLGIAVFVIAWIGQFWGHKIEGKKPSFLHDIQFLLIGPAWLLHFIYKKIGIEVVSNQNSRK